MPRRLELSDATTRKFWEIDVAGKQTTITFGKLGSTGQTRLKKHASPAAAIADAERQIAEKRRAGYVEVGGPPARKAPRAAKATKATTTPTIDPGFAELCDDDDVTRPVAWSAVSARLRRRIDPDHECVIAALVRGWRIRVKTRKAAEAVLAKVSALEPAGACEPAAILAAPGWKLYKPAYVVFGAIIGARSSDDGPDRKLWLAKGPASMPTATLASRLAWADQWIATAFRGFAEAAAPPATYFVVGGAMGDGWLALGGAGTKLAGVPYRRTTDRHGYHHAGGVAGIELAHAAWDEEACVEVDLDEPALAKLRRPRGKQDLVIGASYDARS